MSYDFWSFRLKPGEDPSETVQALMEMEESEQDSGPRERSPVTEAWQKSLADAVSRANSAMVPFAMQYDRIAEHEGITVEEAKRKYTWIELNGGEDGNGIQVVIYDSYATITVPYWHEGEAAAQVFREIWTYLGVLQKEGKLVTFDPQLERVLDLDRDLDEAVTRYLQVMGKMPGIIGQAAAQSAAGGAPDTPPADAREKKPWWRKLFGG